MSHRIGIHCSMSHHSYVTSQQGTQDHRNDAIQNKRQYRWQLIHTLCTLCENNPRVCCVRPVTDCQRGLSDSWCDGRCLSNIVQKVQQQTDRSDLCRSGQHQHSVREWPALKLVIGYSVEHFQVSMKYLG